MIDLDRAGAVERPDGEGRAGGGACDDRVRFTLALEHGRLAAVRFGADACPAATGAAAWLAGQAEGSSLLDAARLGSRAAHRACGIGGARLGCIEVAVDAFHAALGDAVARGGRVPGSGRLAVAMSGGVDSAVALAEAPGGAFGITLRLWIDPLAPDTDRACCAPGSVRRARDLCHERGLPHVSLDLRDAFRAAIVEPFVDGYEAGETPNPCTSCNGDFRLHELVDAAERLGAERVRTGHYARIVDVDGGPLVARGADDAKDQSYMLARVPPEVLARLEFPLGSRMKPEVRARAAALGLAAAGARESQEVCFLGGGDYRSFLQRYGGEAAVGTIEDEAGHRLGRHAGVAGFTPGQRRGIGVSAAEPLYVLRTEPARGAVVVAPLRRLGTRRVALRDVVMHRERRQVDAKLRYRSPAVRATVLGHGDDRTLALDRELYAVAPGQTAALYDGDAVVGCGTIARAAPDDDGSVL